MILPLKRKSKTPDVLLKPTEKKKRTREEINESGSPDEGTLRKMHVKFSCTKYKGCEVCSPWDLREREIWEIWEIFTHTKRLDHWFLTSTCPI